MQRLNRVILTFFGTGYAPFAKGTFASIAAAVLGFLIKDSLIYLYVTIILIAAGFFAIKLSILEEKDPSWIVIDEAAGMMVTFMFLPKTLGILVLGFALFRIFDIFKIFPINKLEHLKAPYGIMLDDILAGIFSNIILQVVLKFAKVSLV